MTDKKKILIISEVFFPEEFLINDLAFEWIKSGFDISVLSRNPSYPNGKIYPGYKNRFFTKEKINEIDVTRVQFIPGYKRNNAIRIINYLWNMFLGMIWAIKHGGRFDHVYVYQTGPLTFSAIAVLIKKLYNKKITIWTQDVWPDTVYAYGLGRTKISKFLLEKFVKIIYSNIDNITVSSPGFIPIIEKYSRGKEITFIPQWSLTKRVNHRNMESHHSMLPGKFNFIFAGNIGKVQNLENVILGFNRFISQTDESIWLNIFGEGSHFDYLQNLVKEKSIRNIKFWGRVNSVKISDYFKNADVLIISLDNKPIFNATVPAKFQAYINAGKPIFGVIAGEVAKLINHHELGWTATPDDISDIADKFRLISLSQQDSFEKIRINSELLTQNQFNREKLINEISKFIVD